MTDVSATPPYGDSYDLLAETCQERWTAQFEREDHRYTQWAYPTARAWLDSLPPPRPGSHESDLPGSVGPWVFDPHGLGSAVGWYECRRWSRGQAA